jgi:glucokinase
MLDAGVSESDVYSCCIACAGPVIANKCTMTNLQWTVDGEAIQQHHSFKTAVRVTCSSQPQLPNGNAWSR